MQLLCGSCGAAAPNVGMVASFKCEFCDQTTYNQAYVESYLSKIDLAKFSHHLRLGKVAFEGGNYKGAAEKFDAAIAEDASKAEAWAYKGVALAHQVNLSNVTSLPNEVDACMREAMSIAPDDDFIVAAGHVAQSLIVGQLWRLATRAHDEAEKAYFAFEDNPPMAAARSAPQYELAMLALGTCLERPSNDIQQMLAVCRFIIEMSYDLRVPSAPGVEQLAYAYVAEVRLKHPKIDAAMPEPPAPAKKAACLPTSSLIATPRGPVAIGHVRAGDLVWAPDEAGQLTARRVIAVHTAVNEVHAVSFIDHDFPWLATPSHTVQTTRGWQCVGDLRPGDEMMFVADGRGLARVVAEVRPGARRRVVNLLVAGERTFIADGAVVHCFSRLRVARSVLHALWTERLPGVSRAEGAAR